MKTTNGNGSKTYIELRWMGEEETELELLGSVGLEDIQEIAPGYRERRLKIPLRYSDAAFKSLVLSGARVLNLKLWDPEP